MNNMNQAPAKMITAILDHLSQESVQRWGANLVSIVLFGSLARGDAHQHSDIDLLLVVRNLPQGWRERSTLELSFERLGLQWGKPLQVILVEPGEVRLAVDDVMPLLLAPVRNSQPPRTPSASAGYPERQDRNGLMGGEERNF